MNYENQIKKIEVVDKEIFNLITRDERVEKEITDTLKWNDKFYTMLSKINASLDQFSMKEVHPWQPPWLPPPLSPHFATHNRDGMGI